MKWTSLNDLREMYLSFFESKGHLRLGSFSLVPDKRQIAASHKCRNGPSEKVLHR